MITPMLIFISLAAPQISSVALPWSGSHVYGSLGSPLAYVRDNKYGEATMKVATIDLEKRIVVGDRTVEFAMPSGVDEDGNLKSFSFRSSILGPQAWEGEEEPLDYILCGKMLATLGPSWVQVSLGRAAPTVLAMEKDDIVALDPLKYMAFLIGRQQSDLRIVTIGESGFRSVPIGIENGDSLHFFYAELSAAVSPAGNIFVIAGDETARQARVELNDRDFDSEPMDLQVVRIDPGTGQASHVLGLRRWISPRTYYGPQRHRLASSGRGVVLLAKSELLFIDETGA